MKVEDINALDIIVNVARHNLTSVVEIKFKRNEIIIKASMRCSRNVKDESLAQNKILRYLGFNDFQIKGLRHE